MARSLTGYVTDRSSAPWGSLLGVRWFNRDTIIDKPYARTQGLIGTTWKMTITVLWDKQVAPANLI